MSGSCRAVALVVVGRLVAWQARDLNSADYLLRQIERRQPTITGDIVRGRQQRYDDLTVRPAGQSWQDDAVPLRATSSALRSEFDSFPPCTVDHVRALHDTHTIAGMEEVTVIPCNGVPRDDCVPFHPLYEVGSRPCAWSWSDDSGRAGGHSCTSPQDHSMEHRCSCGAMYP